MPVRFIRAIRVADFRSIAAAAATDLRDVTPVVGLNGSGKSNLMRALNLLCRDTVEGSPPIDLNATFASPAAE
jgi:AAA15 family ATPase/GTPase